MPVLPQFPPSSPVPTLAASPAAEAMVCATTCRCEPSVTSSNNHNISQQTLKCVPQPHVTRSPPKTPKTRYPLSLSPSLPSSPHSNNYRSMRSRARSASECVNISWNLLQLLFIQDDHIRLVRVADANVPVDECSEDNVTFFQAQT